MLLLGRCLGASSEKRKRERATGKCDLASGLLSRLRSADRLNCQSGVAANHITLPRRYKSSRRITLVVTNGGGIPDLFAQ
jgi:hypothetical protein